MARLIDDLLSLSRIELNEHRRPDTEVDLVGIPEKNAAGEPLDDIVFDVVVSTVEGLPRARRRDADATAESVRRAVRSALNEQWGKKPICLVHVLTI